MVLLFNVYITPSKGNQFVIFDRGNLKSSNKLDVTKYTLSSLAHAYPWSKAIINIELDPNHYTPQDSKNIYNFIIEEFSKVKVVFSNKRCTLQKNWQELYYKINSDLIFYLGNHDHIFMDSSNTCLENLVKISKNYENPTIITSHYPENIRWAKSGYIELNEINPRNLNKDFKINDDHLSYKGICIDSLNIISKSLYYKWFFEGDWRDQIELPRTDGIGGLDLIRIKNSLGIDLPLQDIIIPYKEQLRHFDGYVHQRISNNICPSLSIPDGFFESKIKIRYGYDDYKQGWVNINPKNSNYYAYNKNGADYKLTLEDIPLFWKNRISEIDINNEINEEEMIQHRLHSIQQMIYSDTRYNSYIEDEVIQKIFNTHLQNRPQYKLI